MDKSWITQVDTEGGGGWGEGRSTRDFGVRLSPGYCSLGSCDPTHHLIKGIRRHNFNLLSLPVEGGCQNKIESLLSDMITIRSVTPERALNRHAAAERGGHDAQQPKPQCSAADIPHS